MHTSMYHYSQRVIIGQHYIAAFESGLGVDAPTRKFYYLYYYYYYYTIVVEWRVYIIKLVQYISYKELLKLAHSYACA